MIFDYKGCRYPEYLKAGNACRFITPAALHFCKGNGLDVGAGKWPLPGAIPVDLANGGDATNLPEGQYDFVFSSHCLEHLANPVTALEHWKSRIKPGGVIFLYLPNADAMSYWRPVNCRKHLHQWRPGDIELMLAELGFEKIIRTEGWDSYWSFMVVGFVPFPLPEMTAIKDRILSLYGSTALKRSALNIRDGEGVLRRILSGGRFRVVLEIGTYKGAAAACMAQFCERVITIDLHHGRLEQLGEPWDRQAFWRSLGVANVDLHLVHDDEEKASLVRSLDFDFAFVDGAHDPSVRSDFELVRRCRTVLFHDYDRRGSKETDYVADFIDTLPKEELEVFDIFALWTAPRG